MLLAGTFEQAEHQVPGALLATGIDHRVEGTQPLAGLLRIDVRQLGGDAVLDHAQPWCGLVVH